MKSTSETVEVPDTQPIADGPDNLMINSAKSRNTSSNTERPHPANIRKVLSDNKPITRRLEPQCPSSLKFKNIAHQRYTISQYHSIASHHGALVDRGANGGWLVRMCES